MKERGKLLISCQLLLDYSSHKKRKNSVHFLFWKSWCWSSQKFREFMQRSEPSELNSVFWSFVTKRRSFRTKFIFIITWVLISIRTEGDTEDQGNKIMTRVWVIHPCDYSFGWVEDEVWWKRRREKWGDGNELLNPLLSPVSWRDDVQLTWWHHGLCYCIHVCTGKMFLFGSKDFFSIIFSVIITHHHDFYQSHRVTWLDYDGVQKIETENHHVQHDVSNRNNDYEKQLIPVMMMSSLKIHEKIHATFDKWFWCNTKSSRGDDHHGESCVIWFFLENSYYFCWRWCCASDIWSFVT